MLVEWSQGEWLQKCHTAEQGGHLCLCDLSRASRHICIFSASRSSSPSGDPLCSLGQVRSIGRNLLYPVPAGSYCDRDQRPSDRRIGLCSQGHIRVTVSPSCPLGSPDSALLGCRQSVRKNLLKRRSFRNGYDQVHMLL